MRKLYVLVMALFAVFAFSAYAASSALAVAEWLWNGAKIPAGEELLTDVEGDLILIHLAGGFLEPEVKILCEGIFDGYVLGGPGADNLGGEDLVTELLSLSGGTISATTPLLCTTLAGPCEGTPDVYAENLPWLTKLELMVVTGGSLYLDLFTEDTETYNGLDEHLPAYHIDCIVVSVLHEVLCEGETSADLTLSGTELLGIFNAAELISEKLEGLCEEAGTDHPEVAVQEGEGVILHLGGGELDVSE